MRLQARYEGVVGLSFRVGAAVHEPQLTAGRAHPAHVAHEARGGGLRGGPLQRGRVRRRGERTLVAGAGEGQRGGREEGGRPRAEGVHSLVGRHAAHLRQTRKQC